MPKRSSWKNERASVSRKGSNRSRSNKFAKSDTTRRPEPGSRSRVWVAGYTRADGTEVAGHFRQLRNGGRGGQGGSRGGGRKTVAKSRNARGRTSSRRR